MPNTSRRWHQIRARFRRRDPDARLSPKELQAVTDRINARVRDEQVRRGFTTGEIRHNLRRAR